MIRSRLLVSKWNGSGETLGLFFLLSLFEKYEEARKEYKRELLSNQAWTHAILQLALVGKIDAETQNLLYKMHNNEMEFVYEKLL